MGVIFVPGVGPLANELHFSYILAVKISSQYTDKISRNSPSRLAIIIYRRTLGSWGKFPSFFPDKFRFVKA